MKINKIDTRHGTANQSTFSHGNCLPYTGFPWGMNYFAPSTGAARGAWWFHQKTVPLKATESLTNPVLGWEISHI